MTAATMSLARRALSAGGWSLGGHFATQILRFGSNLVMTRLLMPETFGVMALALTFMYALNMFSDVGLRQVAVQHARGHEKSFLDMLWTVQILRGALIMAVGLLVAAAVLGAARAGWAPVGSAYAHPDLPGVVALLAFSALISGLESTKIISMGRELNLRNTVLLEIYAQIFGFAVMVAIATSHPSVYALAAGAIASALLRCVLSHLWLQGHPNALRWEHSLWQEIYRFGRWIFLTSILGFLISAGDKLFLGGILPASDLGIYTIAMMIVLIVHELGHRIASSVAYPAVSEVVRTRPEGVCDTYYRLRLPVDAIAFAAAGFLWVAGPALIELFYDPRYAKAGEVLAILSLSLVILGWNSSGNVYMALGKPWLMTVLLSVRLVALVVAVPVGAHLHGLTGAAWGVVVSYLAMIPPMYVLKRRHGLWRWKLEAVAPMFAVAGLAAGLVVTRLVGALPV